jgi:hypothetical protein
MLECDAMGVDVSGDVRSPVVCQVRGSGLRGAADQEHVTVERLQRSKCVAESEVVGGGVDDRTDGLLAEAA